MAGYITTMSTPLPPHILADLHKVCSHDPMAVSTINMLISEISRVSEQIAAVAPACSDLVVAFNTQFLPADHEPQEPSDRGAALSTPPPSPCLPRLARQAPDAHSDITISMPSNECRMIFDTNALDSTLFGTDTSTISHETRSDDDTMSVMNDNVCSEYDALNTMLRKQFGDFPTLTSGDPDTSVLADANPPPKDIAMPSLQAASTCPLDPLPRCKLPCSYGDWNPDPWLNCQRPCKRAIGHRGRHHCLLMRHPGFDHDQLKLLGSPDSLPSPTRCCCPNSCRAITEYRFTLCDECQHRSPSGICPCVFSSHGQCCQKWDGAAVTTDANAEVSAETMTLPSLPTSSGLPKTDKQIGARPSRQAGTPYTGAEEGLSPPPKPKQSLADYMIAPAFFAKHTGISLPDLVQKQDEETTEPPVEPSPMKVSAETMSFPAVTVTPGCLDSPLCHSQQLRYPPADWTPHPSFLAFQERSPGKPPGPPVTTAGGDRREDKQTPSRHDEHQAPGPHARRLISTYNGLTSQGRRPARPALQYPYEPRPSHLPPGCHVCNIEHTLHAEDDELVMCNHPDGCGQLAHTDTCARACPSYPDKMICNLCYRPEHVLDSRPDLISAPTLPSQFVWSLLDDADGNSATTDNAATWVWSPHAVWSPTAGCFQGQVIGSPGAGHVCNPYCIHSNEPPGTPTSPLTPLQLQLQSLLRTAQNLAECHSMLASTQTPGSASDNEPKRRKKGD